MAALGLALGGFILFCNGYVAAETDSREEEYFFQKWNNEIDESQEFRIGKVMMSMFYIIPTAGACISWCKFKLAQPSKRKSLE